MACKHDFELVCPDCKNESFTVKKMNDTSLSTRQVDCSRCDFVGSINQLIVKETECEHHFDGGN